MAGKAVPKMKGVRVFPPAPKGFDALAASKTDLARHGIPQRPDPRTQPGAAALGRQRMRRYQDFEHLEPSSLPPISRPSPFSRASGCRRLYPAGSSWSFPAPIVIFSGTWTGTEPQLHAGSGRVSGPPPYLLRPRFPRRPRGNDGRCHPERHCLDYDSHRGASRPSCSPRQRNQRHPVSANRCRRYAFYGLTNETTSQTVNFNIDTGFPPAVAINAGITRDGNSTARPIRWLSSAWYISTNSQPSQPVEYRGSPTVYRPRWSTPTDRPWRHHKGLPTLHSRSSARLIQRMAGIRWRM